MANSYYSSYEHIVFSTKRRQNWLSLKIAPELHRYLGGAVKKQNCIPLIVGGMPNHIHMLVRKKSDLTSADLIKEIKRSSSEWLSARELLTANFIGRMAMEPFRSVIWDVDTIVQYITNQERHHASIPWEVEFKEIAH